MTHQNAADDNPVRCNGNNLDMVWGDDQNISRHGDVGSRTRWHQVILKNLVCGLKEGRKQWLVVVSIKTRPERSGFQRGIAL